MSSQPNPATEPVVPTLSASEVWLEKNFKKVVMLCIAVIVVAIVYGVIRYRTDEVALEAAMAFTGADTVEGLDAVISKYPGSVAAGNALLAKADLLWEKNQKDSSAGALKKLLADFSGHPLLVEAKMSLASRLDAMGEKAEAKKLFEEIISQNPDSHATPLAEIRLGDLLWTEGKVEEAKEIYSSLPSKYPGTNQPFFDQSQDRLKWISAALPTKEVDAPKPPPAPEAPATPAAGAPGAVTVPPIKLSGGSAPPPMNVTVRPEGGVVTPAVKVEAKPAAPAAMPAKPDAAPAKPETAPAPAPAKPETAPPPAPAPVKPEATPATPAPAKP
jgi:predicted negative regulator of RcsB-dependent stress response